MTDLRAPALAVAVAFGVGWWLRGAEAPPRPEPGVAHLAEARPARHGGDALVRPLLECDLSSGPGRLAGLRDRLTALVEAARRQARATDVAIDVRDMQTTEEVVIGEDLGFTPASLFKLPVVLAVLKLSERDQSLLDRRLLFMMPDDEFTQQIAPDRTLVPGQEYTVRQLVEQTLTESDNSAVNLLHGLLPGDLVFETFRDLELPVPTRDHIENFYKVREYAAFLRTLYNASYLSPEKSEWAMELLADARFRDGIVAGVPDTIRVAHKFGERHLYDGPPGTHQQLHDCGIVYFPGHPYLLCVMTRGESLPVLGGVIRDISAAVYDDYARRDPAGVAVR